MGCNAKIISITRFVLILVLKGLAGFIVLNTFIGTPFFKDEECLAALDEEQYEFSEMVPPPFRNPGNWENPNIPPDMDFMSWFNRVTWKQDDPALVEAVKQMYLINPKDGPYNINMSESVERRSSDGQVQAMEGVLRKLTPGIFIECGANNGQLRSNTLWLEQELGWTGLLAECDPYVFRQLLHRNRKSWAINVCLSESTYPQPIRFWRNPIETEFGGLIKDPKWGAVVPVGAQSVPLFTILLAMNRTTIDFFSLDVSGSELLVLKTIPFERVTFKVIWGPWQGIAEIITVDYAFIPEGEKGLQNFMESKGYVLHKEINTPTTKDLIFVHPSLLKLLR